MSVLLSGAVQLFLYLVCLQARIIIKEQPVFPPWHCHMYSTARLIKTLQYISSLLHESCTHSAVLGKTDVSQRGSLRQADSHTYLYLSCAYCRCVNIVLQQLSYCWFILIKFYFWSIWLKRIQNSHFIYLLYVIFKFSCHLFMRPVMRRL